MIETSLLVLFLSGLLGGGHCVGMCGGIVTALSISLPRKRRRWPMLLGYNVGRIASYMAIGALLGGAVEASSTLATRPLQLALSGFANIMIIGLGLYLAGLSNAVTHIEHLGRPLWGYLHPYIARLLPIKTVPHAVLAGAIWGWLPCGLVYSASLSALATGHWASGALIMLAFGLGTLPNLLAMGLFAAGLKHLSQQRMVRFFAGLAVVLLGTIQLSNTIRAAWAL